MSTTQRTPQPRSQGTLSTLREYPGYGWSRVYARQPKPHRGWVLNLILSALSREVNVVLLYGRYFEKEEGYLSEILPSSVYHTKGIKKYDNREIIDGNIQLGATFLSENWIYR